MAEVNVNATDSAIELAAANNVDLATVTGTGAEGKITKGDVQKVIDAAAAPQAPAPTTQEPQAPVVEAPAPVAPAVSAEADPDREARWKAFLARAREDAVKNGTLHVFEEQEARGEFATIPATFA